MQKYSIPSTTGSSRRRILFSPYGRITTAKSKIILLTCRFTYYIQANLSVNINVYFLPFSLQQVRAELGFSTVSHFRFPAWYLIKISDDVLQHGSSYIKEIIPGLPLEVHASGCTRAPSSVFSL